MAAVFGAVVLGGALFLVIRVLRRPSDEELIHRLIKTGQKAIEDEDLAGCMKVVSVDYRDSSGLTYDELKGMGLRIFHYFTDISVQVTHIDITLREEGTAEVALTVEVQAMVEGVGRELWPSAGGDRVKLSLRKKRGRWKILALEEAPLRFD